MFSLVAPSRLTAAYDKASGRWHDRLTALGFVAAYHALAEEGVQQGGRAAAVLDAGCGTGGLSEAWVTKGGLARGGRLDLLDPSERMLEHASRRLAGSAPRAIAGGIGSAALQENCYDVVLCAHVIEHLDDPFESLSWLRARLRPGGRMILVVSQPHWCTALVRLRWGSKAWKPQEVLGMLGEVGFRGAQVKRFAAGPPSRLSCGYLVQN